MFNLKKLFKKESKKGVIKIDLSIKDKAKNNHNFLDCKDCNLLYAIDLLNYTNMNALNMNFLTISRALIDDKKGVK